MSQGAVGPPDPARFRQVLGHFATGVTVVASMDESGPVGLTVGSFASLSLDPPLALACIDRNSASWPAIERVGAFAVSILGDDQEELCRIFAGKGDEKFAGVGWHRSPGGSPVIDTALAWIDCTVDDVIEGGDHFAVVGRVRDLGVQREGGPLIFYRGGFTRLTS